MNTSAATHIVISTFTNAAAASSMMDKIKASHVSSFDMRFSTGRSPHEGFDLTARPKRFAIMTQEELYQDVLEAMASVITNHLK